MTARACILTAGVCLFTASQPGMALQLPGEGNGSSLLDRAAMVVIRNASLGAALKQLAQASRVPVAFSPSLVSAESHRVDCDCLELTVQEALDQLLAHTTFRYRELRGEVLVYPAAPQSNLIPQSPMTEAPMLRSISTTLGCNSVRMLATRMCLGIALLTPTVAHAQGTINGRVVETGTQRPLVGAQVSIAGTGLGTTANNDGRYVLVAVPPGRATVRVQIIGYATEERAVTVVTGETVVADFELNTQALGLDEIVVTGTAGGTQRRAIGNVVGSLSVERVVEVTAPANVQQLLSGQIPGVGVQLGGGNVGSGGNIVIRGMSTLDLNSHPLVYVDGIRVNGGTAGSVAGSGVSRLNDLNPEDIERLEVIKGPAAATLYGTEASNGVIQIITKKGRPGDVSVDLSIRQGANWFHDAENRIPPNYQLLPDGTIISQNLIKEEREAGRPIFRTGRVQSYGLSLRGGQGRFNYYLSGNHEDEEGFQFNNEMRRSSLRSNLQLAASDQLDISADVGVTRSHGQFVSDGQAGGFGAINLIYGGDPNDRNTHLRGFGTGPPEVFRDLDNSERLNRATASVTMAHRPTAWFSHRLVAGTDWTDANRSLFIPRLPEGSFPYYGANSVGNKSLEHLRDLNQTVDYSATASFDLMPSVTSATSVGVQYFMRESLSATATGNNMPTPAVSTVSAAAVRSGSESYVENKTFGVFIQQTMGWRNQAFVTAALRADANSAFGESFDAAYYPKLSGTWVVSDADFFNIGFIDNLRLRGAWGRSGLQPDAFAALRTYAPTPGPGELPTVTPGNLGNPDLRPEVGQELELGFDIGLLQNRIAVEFTHYRQRTTDLIVQELVAPSLGFSGARFVNIGEVTNHGYEIRLDTRPIATSSVKLTLGLAAALNNNLLVDLGGRQVQADTRGRWQHVEGYEMGSMWTKYIATAEWGPNRTLVNVTCKGPKEDDFRPMPCADAPFHYYGDPSPGWTGSFTNNLTLWDRLNLNALWVFVTDSRLFNTTKGDGVNGRTLNSMSLRLGTMDPLVAAAIETADVEHDQFERDDYLRLRDISASYNLPGRWVERFGASRASITLSGRNLITVYHPSYGKDGSRVHDPETKAQRNAPWPGWQQTRVPLAHTIVTTLRVAF
jgi:TonB-dependent SusC/RagA subfamily outer membrane receptor